MRDVCILLIDKMETGVCCWSVREPRLELCQTLRNLCMSSLGLCFFHLMRRPSGTLISRLVVLPFKPFPYCNVLLTVIIITLENGPTIKKLTECVCILVALSSTSAWTTEPTDYEYFHKSVSRLGTKVSPEDLVPAEVCR